jgi:hypothetical protein
MNYIAIKYYFENKNNIFGVIGYEIKFGIIPKFYFEDYIMKILIIVIKI